MKLALRKDRMRLLPDEEQKHRYEDCEQGNEHRWQETRHNLLGVMVAIQELVLQTQLRVRPYPS
jgi:hypothetical protein